VGGASALGSNERRDKRCRGGINGQRARESAVSDGGRAGACRCRPTMIVASSQCRSAPAVRPIERLGARALWLSSTLPYSVRIPRVSRGVRAFRDEDLEPMHGPRQAFPERHQRQRVRESGRQWGRGLC
jgi:hypothetical protein